jgi:hypothetical protein
MTVLATPPVTDVRAAPARTPARVPGASLLRHAVAVLLVTLWFLPLNFAVLTGVALQFYTLVLGVAAVTGLVMMYRGDRLLPLLTAAFGFLLLVAFLQERSLNPTTTMLLQIVAGYTLRWLCRSGVVAAYLMAAASTTALMVDLLVHDHVFMSLFGATYFPSVLDDRFRAQGIIGQPLPAALLTITLLVYVGIAAKPAGRAARRWLMVSLVGMSLCALYATGTRSGLILVAVLWLLIWVERTHRSRRGELRRFLGTSTGVGVTLVVAFLLWGRDLLGTTRLFDFTGLSGSDSYEVRSQAVTIIADLTDLRPCSTFCTAFGSGQGSLSENLRMGAGVNGVSVIDNQFLTAYWDFGVVGALLLALPVLRALWVLGTVGNVPARAGAVGVLSVMAMCLFYDALYVSSAAFLLGFFLFAREPVRHGGTSGTAGVPAATDPPAPRGES